MRIAIVCALAVAGLAVTACASTTDRADVGSTTTVAAEAPPPPPPAYVPPPPPPPPAYVPPADPARTGERG